nr:MAG TPA: hypothetical protein [Caudoviricetes sp.]
MVSPVFILFPHFLFMLAIMYTHYVEKYIPKYNLFAKSYCNY